MRLPGLNALLQHRYIPCCCPASSQQHSTQHHDTPYYRLGSKVTWTRARLILRLTANTVWCRQRHHSVSKTTLNIPLTRGALALTNCHPRSCVKWQLDCCQTEKMTQKTIIKCRDTGHGGFQTDMLPSAKQTARNTHRVTVIVLSFHTQDWIPERRKTRL